MNLSRLGLWIIAASTSLPWMADAATPPIPEDSELLDEVIVTARKRPEPLIEVPIALTRITDATLERYGVKSFADYANRSPGLTFGLGSGPTGISSARVVAIRGVGGQNFMGTAGATAFYLDDTPIPMSIDPELAEVEYVEVLRGPQGTLYGEGSLGGNVRLVTRKPSLTSNDLRMRTAGGVTLEGGSPNLGVDAGGNLVLVGETLAVRWGVHANHDAGYLRRTYPTDPTSFATTDPTLSVPRTEIGDQGARRRFAGNLTLRWQLSEGNEASIRWIGGIQRDKGFQATFAPLPAFTPVSVQDRAFDVQPFASDHWQIAAADFDVRRSVWSWHTTLGHTHRWASDKEDATYGTQQILSGYYGLEGLPAQPFLWVGDRSLSQWTLESRVALQPVAAWSAIFGVYGSQADSRYETPPTYASGLQSASQQPNAVGAWPNDLLWSITVPATQRDLSAFAEVDFHVTPKWMVSTGLRVYRLSQRIDNLIDGYLNFGPTPSNPQRNHESGTSPKLAFTYLPREGVSVWTSAAKGFRAGGAQASLPFCALPGLSDYDITHLKSDSLWSYEVGTRVERQSVNISAAVYRIDWKNFQQLTALPCGAFVSINGGTARSRGMELELDLYPAAHWHIRANAGYQDTRVSDPGNLSWSGVSTGNRLAGIPRWTGSLSADHEWWLAGGRSIFAAADYSRTASSTAPLNAGGGTSIARSGYGIANARFGLRQDKWELAVNVRNLGNARPNLGDIGYNGYAQFGTGIYAGGLIPVVATMPPLTAMVEFTYRH